MLSQYFGRASFFSCGRIMGPSATTPWTETAQNLTYGKFTFQHRARQETQPFNTGQGKKHSQQRTLIRRSDDVPGPRNISEIAKSSIRYFRGCYGNRQKPRREGRFTWMGICLLRPLLVWDMHAALLFVILSEKVLQPCELCRAWCCTIVFLPSDYVALGSLENLRCA